jgi:hypothetical protein
VLPRHYHMWVLWRYLGCAFTQDWDLCKFSDEKRDGVKIIWQKKLGISLKSLTCAVFVIVGSLCRDILNFPDVCDFTQKHWSSVRNNNVTYYSHIYDIAYCIISTKCSRGVTCHHKCSLDSVFMQSWENYHKWKSGIWFKNFAFFPPFWALKSPSRRHRGQICSVHDLLSPVTWTLVQNDAVRRMPGTRSCPRQCHVTARAGLLCYIICQIVESDGLRVLLPRCLLESDQQFAQRRGSNTSRAFQSASALYCYVIIFWYPFFCSDVFGSDASTKQSSAAAPDEFELLQQQRETKCARTAAAAAS